MAQVKIHRISPGKIGGYQGYKRIKLEKRAESVRVFGRDITNQTQIPPNKKYNVHRLFDYKSGGIYTKQSSVSHIAPVEKPRLQSSSFSNRLVAHRAAVSEIGYVESKIKEFENIRIKELEEKLPREDQKNLENPMTCAEYAGDIFTHMLSMEPIYQAEGEYMPRHPELNHRMRAILLDWLVEVHLKFKLRQETLFLSFNIIDRFLSRSNSSIPKCNFQLIGVTSMFIASKSEEIYPPELKDFIAITDKSYTKQDIVNMEIQIMITLNYAFNLPYPSGFLGRYALFLSPNKLCLNLSKYMMELSLMDMGMLKYPFSLKTLAALYVAMRITNSKYKANAFEAFSYKKAEVKQCAKELALLLQAAEKHPLQAIRRKYTLPDNGQVGKIKIEQGEKQIRKIMIEVDGLTPAFIHLMLEVTMVDNEKVKNKFAELGPYAFGQYKMPHENLEIREVTDIPDEGKYTGYWNKGTDEREGAGCLIYTNGGRYDGYWRNNKKSGKGREIYKTGHFYDGDYHNNAPHGTGAYTHLDGHLYTGTWRTNKQHGHGIEIWQDQTFFDGDYQNGMKDGDGAITWPDQSEYNGQFKRNTLNGKGVYKWSNGNNYNGEYKEGKRHGSGVFTWSDGRKYDGEWMRGMKHGKGTYTWPNGKSHKGHWEKGKKHGKGTFIASDSTKKKGVWKRGKIDSWRKEEI